MDPPCSCGVRGAGAQRGGLNWEVGEAVGVGRGVGTQDGSWRRACWEGGSAASTAAPLRQAPPSDPLTSQGARHRRRPIQACCLLRCPTQIAMRWSVAAIDSGTVIYGTPKQAWSGHADGGCCCGGRGACVGGWDLPWILTHR